MTKLLRFLLVLPILLLAFCATTAFTNVPTAHAAPLPGCRNLTHSYLGITESGPFAIASGYNGTSQNSTLTLSQTQTISNTVTGQFGFSYSVISAQIGYNVTASTAVAFSYAITVPPGRTGHIYGYADFWTYKVVSSNCGTAYAYIFDGSVSYIGFTN